MGIAKPELKAEAIRLRVEKRHSLREIETITGAARGSLSAWLKPHPLTEDEKKARSKLAKRYVTPKSKHTMRIKGRKFATLQIKDLQQGIS